MREDDTQAMLAYLRDIAESLHEIARVQGVMLARSTQGQAYVPGGLMLRQDGDHLQRDANVNNQLSD
jgi:hypothetical protein